MMKAYVPFKFTMHGFIAINIDGDVNEKYEAFEKGFDELEDLTPEEIMSKATPDWDSLDIDKSRNIEDKQGEAMFTGDEIAWEE